MLAERNMAEETQLKEGGMQQITELKQRVEELESLLEKAHFKQGQISCHSALLTLC